MEEALSEPGHEVKPLAEPHLGVLALLVEKDTSP